MKQAKTNRFSPSPLRILIARIWVFLRSKLTVPWHESARSSWLRDLLGWRYFLIHVESPRAWQIFLIFLDRQFNLYFMWKL